MIPKLLKYKADFGWSCYTYIVTYIFSGATLALTELQKSYID